MEEQKSLSELRTPEIAELEARAIDALYDSDLWDFEADKIIGDCNSKMLELGFPLRGLVVSRREFLRVYNTKLHRYKTVEDLLEEGCNEIILIENRKGNISRRLIHEVCIPEEYRGVLVAKAKWSDKIDNEGKATVLDIYRHFSGCDLPQNVDIWMSRWYPDAQNLEYRFRIIM